MYASREPRRDGEIVRRTICLQRAIKGFRGEWFGITMLMKQTGLPKGTIHRYPAIFVAEGILERHLHYLKYREMPEEQDASIAIP